MMTLPTVFWMLVLFFGVIGALRGWTKELLASIAAIWAITLIMTLERFFPIFPVLAPGNKAAFIARMVIFLPMVFFGYHIPKSSRFESKTRRESVRDMFLGLVLGLINGYLIISTIWYYLHETGYPFPYILSPEAAGGLCHPNEGVYSKVSMMTRDLFQDTEDILKWALPKLIGWPWIYFLTLAMGVLLIVVFL